MHWGCAQMWDSRRVVDWWLQQFALALEAESLNRPERLEVVKFNLQVKWKLDDRC
jgi:hypothetical protein